jgi:alpha-tubulin suppressor-like RCC1 family protein
VWVSAGLYSYCAVLATGTAKCWGMNSSGELGDGTTAYPDLSPPVDVLGLTNITSLAVGGTSCATTADGGLYCWGGNSFGSLGFDPGLAGKTSTPTLVPGFG